MVDQLLPPIPSKRYFTIGEVSDLCAVKPHVLRYWEQEFTQLRPMKRRGNRRYYQHHEVLLIRKIRELLYDEGFTIQGARMRLSGRQTLSNLQAEAAALVRLQLAEQESAQGALLQLSSTPTPAMDPESDVGVPRATVMS
ncbi:MAG: MerR family transcriptional regulator, partial [Betaproteobacteria bacterium]|nr:MerR family transcriptional regulator [Betaproteobacteria bacterium]